ncbi:hypothetical protein H6G45_08640 [Synechocystis sp. FACHB-383]|uniref:hypothetical protein n=1 Tax=Synechocystis sp. FACHB-383 TaxID=2692864 RepID=UPI001684E74B|nr:hypothetical protein [Synechocystis sp. FACHB-383]MBD2653557.1 hypothetical protein [Synechocystis sp. FACHB-383]
MLNKKPIKTEELMNCHGNSKPQVKVKGKMAIVLAGLQGRLSQLIKDLSHRCLIFLAGAEESFIKRIDFSY